MVFLIVAVAVFSFQFIYYKNTKVTYAHAPEFQIPHIIHQYWESDDVPRMFVKWIQTWTQLHPTWQYWFWTPKAARRLLAKHFPGYLREFNSYKLNVFRANALRYFIMLKYGGIYADLDLEALQPLDNWTRTTWCFASENSYEHTIMLEDLPRSNMMITILGCRPGHPYYKLAIDRLPTYSKLNGHDKLFYADKIYLEHINNQGNHSPEQNIMTIARPVHFLPTYDFNWKSHIVVKKCKRHDISVLQKSVCAERARQGNKPTRESYTTHYWVHVVMWKKTNKEFKHVVSIYDIVPHAHNMEQVLLTS
jgi:hypothetical protein